MQKKDGSKSLFGSCEGQVINQLTSQGSGLPGADKELQSSLPTGLLEGEGELQQIRERRDTFDSIFQETDEQLTITNDSNVVPSINKDSFVLVRNYF